MSATGGSGPQLDVKSQRCSAPKRLKSQKEPKKLPNSEFMSAGRSRSKKSADQKPRGSPPLSQQYPASTIVNDFTKEMLRPLVSRIGLSNSPDQMLDQAKIQDLRILPAKLALEMTFDTKQPIGPANIIDQFGNKTSGRFVFGKPHGLVIEENGEHREIFESRFGKRHGAYLGKWASGLTVFGSYLEDDCFGLWGFKHPDNSIEFRNYGYAVLERLLTLN